eukprot:gnl/TRDRNA2_/TRDRNA2_91946_c0_seq2.p1 gnl/TRDRNA2_/TRDRNA2_91946_c0~~gnl/TRDRNA2_/TRDRNA2_91946_c0_seq2.p1  ORF type:complete len:637 (+),score=119.97 gnl/TRDRNA2_/TRDRNA2_91946_c0_seq2:61-1911(+)
MTALTGTEMRDEVNQDVFAAAINRLGWTDGFESILFDSLDIEIAGKISVANLKWLETEKKRQRRKEMAKRQAMHNNMKRINERKAALELLASFKSLLKRKYGHFVRAWRSVLVQDDSMVLKRHDLYKAAVDLGWVGDVRLLWKALDKDDSGIVTIEELDARSAESLAHFRIFIGQRFGSAAAGFKALDKYHTKSLHFPEFVAACKSFGFDRPSKSLFQSLDWGNNKRIVEDDILFLDRWSPSLFLVAKPNAQAAEELKMLLLKVYKHYLKAWRAVLDLDNSNSCNWEEFESACKKINFSGDVAGAWRHLDDDFSGFITLAEIDKEASGTLLVFKQWADAEFGSVKSAFSVFDNDNSGEISYREFRRACRQYGFDNDVHGLFHALDVEKNGVLGTEEVVFLDEWDLRVDQGSEADEEQRGDSKAQIKQLKGHKSYGGDLIEYSTVTPGPGAYSLPTTIGSVHDAPMVTQARFAVAPAYNAAPAYSIRRRLPANKLLPGITKDDVARPAPNCYNDGPGWSARSDRIAKPNWTFGGAARESNSHVSAPSKYPGPGTYMMQPTHGARSVGAAGVAHSCSPRRPLRVHPLFREAPVWGPPPGAAAPASARRAPPPPQPRPF